MSKIKMAIGFPKADWNDALERNGGSAITMIEEFLKTADMSIRDRAFCETDHTWLQLLPYVVITNHEGKFLSYRRPDTGDETKLHGLYSIGFGGHMDVFDDDHNLMNIVKNARRELLEELPLIKGAVAEEFFNMVQEEVPYSHDAYLTELLYGPVLFTDMAAFVNKSTGVDIFHLGMYLPIRIDASILDLSRSNSEAAEMAWKTEFELRSMNLESWSKEYIHNTPRKNIIIGDNGVIPSVENPV